MSLLVILFVFGGFGYLGSKAAKAAVGNPGATAKAGSLLLGLFKK